MTAIVLLIICVVAQIAIAAWLGIFLILRKKRRGKEAASAQSGIHLGNPPK